MRVHNHCEVGCGRMAAIAAVLVATVCLGMARPALAEEREDSFAKNAGLGVGALLVDFVYMPVKLVYATLGGLTGGLAYGLTAGRTETAMAIWRPSLGGTYVVTPKMLSGEEEIHFSGKADYGEAGGQGGKSPTEEPVGEGTQHSGESY